jgi:hypothetical protein
MNVLVRVAVALFGAFFGSLVISMSMCPRILTIRGLRRSVPLMDPWVRDDAGSSRKTAIDTYVGQALGETAVASRV